jgi:hypothetical protein
MLAAMPRPTVCLLVLFAVLASACGGAQIAEDRRGNTNGRLFEFSTAGSEHTDPYGAWLVRVRGDAMWVAKVANGQTKEYGSYPLAAKDATKLWQLIDDLDILGRSSKRVRSKRTAVYQLTLLRPGLTAYTVILPMERGIKEEAVASAVLYIGTLVKRYTGEKPVLTPQDD